MDLSIAKDVVQILFWIGAFILAFLTYKNSFRVEASVARRLYPEGILTFNRLNFKPVTTDVTL